jgi:predicted transcriptional regulator
MICFLAKKYKIEVVKYPLICFTHMNTIYSMMKKRGFAETIKILGTFENGAAPQKKFFKKFQKFNSYYNAFLRVKPFLTQHNLVDFRCDSDGTKIIYLTEKGLQVLSKLNEIEKILTE